MSVDTAHLSDATQAYRLTIGATSAFQFMLSDVAADGTDSGDIHPYPPPGDPGTPLDLPFTEEVLEVGSISGSVDGGGMDGNLTLINSAVDFSEAVQVDVDIETWYGNIPGVIGAAGTATSARIFTGYVHTPTTTNRYPNTSAALQLRSPISFLKESSLSRSIDWFAGGGHDAPTTAQAVAQHIIESHTNWTSRHQYGLYFEDYNLNTYSLNSNSVHDMLKSLVDNWVEGWVLCRREGDLFIGVHPNLARNAWASRVAAPIMEITDDLVEEWSIPEESQRAEASSLVTATTSDLTPLVQTYYNPGGLGSRGRYTGLRFEDQASVDQLAEWVNLHQNRTYRAVKVSMFMIVQVDLADIVVVTKSNPYRGITWFEKPFVVTGMEYQVNLKAGSFKTVLTLDEVLQ